MRRSSLLLVTVTFGLAAVPFPQAPASASCAAPYLKVGDLLVLHRGSTATIEGRAFTTGGCQDTGACTESFGCESCTQDPPPVPMEDVSLRLVQRDHAWNLGAVDAGSAEDRHLGWVSWTFDLPAGVKRGPAKLVPEHAQPVRVRIQ
jgi:hypothetical protein